MAGLAEQMDNERLKTEKERLFHWAEQPVEVAEPVK
jgi:hypothetical protein